MSITSTAVNMLTIKTVLIWKSLETMEALLTVIDYLQEIVNSIHDILFMWLCSMPYRKYFLLIYIYISAVLSRGWAKASACCFQVCLSCTVLFQVVSFQS